MRVCFAHRVAVQRFSQEWDGNNADLTVIGFQGAEICYEKELKGGTDFFESVARLSKDGNNVVLCGCQTNTLGHIRKSVVVAEKGRLLGVSDMLHAIDGRAGCGASLRVYETGVGRLGVIVADDLKFPEDLRGKRRVKPDI